MGDRVFVFTKSIIGSLVIQDTAPMRLDGNIIQIIPYFSGSERCFHDANTDAPVWILIGKTKQHPDRLDG